MRAFGQVELVELADQGLGETDLTGKKKENPKDLYEERHSVPLWVLLDSKSARGRDHKSFRGQLELLIVLQRG